MLGDTAGPIPGPTPLASYRDAAAQLLLLCRDTFSQTRGGVLAREAVTVRRMEKFAGPHRGEAFTAVRIDRFENNRSRLIAQAVEPELEHRRRIGRYRRGDAGSLGERRGVGPWVVVSDPAVNQDQRLPVLCGVPVTGTPGVGALYPQLSPSGSGLTKASCALVDQIRRVYGDEALRLFLGLDHAGGG